MCRLCSLYLNISEVLFNVNYTIIAIGIIMDGAKRVLDTMPDFIQKIYHSYKNKIQISGWKKQGKPIPVPHAIKQDMISKYREKHGIKTLVESGTYHGEMVWAQQNNFDRIYSIELNKDLAQYNKKRFKKKSHIKIIPGDSGKILPTFIKELNDKTLFWLDGHYSGGDAVRGDKDTPIIDEVKAILTSNIEHVLLISDAHSFTGERDYPTQEGLSAFIRKSCPDSDIHIENDCIVVELHKNEEPE